MISRMNLILGAGSNGARSNHSQKIRLSRGRGHKLERVPRVLCLNVSWIQYWEKVLLQLTYFRDDKDGKYYPKPPIDQKKVQAEIQAAEDIVNNPAKHTRPDFDNAQKTLDKYVEVNGEWYHAQNFPVNIAYGNPVVQ